MIARNLNRNLCFEKNACRAPQNNDDCMKLDASKPLFGTKIMMIA